MTITNGTHPTTDIEKYAADRGVAPETVVTASQAADLARAAEHWGDHSPERRRAPNGRLRPVSSDAAQVNGAAVEATLKLVGLEMPADTAQRIAARCAGLTPEQVIERIDRMMDESDREAYAQGAEARRRNRYQAYLKNRSPKYADASYEMLRPDQRAGGRIERWLSSPRQPRCLLVTGTSRTGKTTALYSIANDAHARGAYVEVFTETALYKGLKNPDTNHAVWTRATECELLFIDDWGRNRATDWWKETLQDLLDYRFGRADQGLRQIVSANTPVDQEQAYAELVDRYGDPIVERMIDGGGIIVFDGPRIRNLMEDW
jgi:DNA replication protein DnaC